MAKEETTTMVKSSMGFVTENLVVIKEELIRNAEGGQGPSSDEMTDGELAYRENVLIEKELMKEELARIDRNIPEQILPAM